MNTTKIGTEFEDKVFDYVSSLLDTNEFLGTTKKYSEIFKHKKYKCPGTNRKIDFDITIETYNAHAKSEEWSSLIIIECKNYNKKVNIADLDELTTKMSCISKSGIKGCMVTTKGYSRTGINQAQKDHIALAVFNNDDMEWYTTRNIRMHSENLMEILLGESKVGYAPVVYNEGGFIGLIDFLKNSGAAISEKNTLDVPYYRDDTIKQKAKELYEKCTFVTNDIAGEVLAQVFPDIRIRFDSLSEGILGMISFKDRVITLSDAIINDVHRMHFTLAHEIGHLSLHEPYLKNHANNFVDYHIDQVKLLQDDLIKRMEQHANKFASYLLIPQNRLDLEVAEYLAKTNNAKGLFYLDNQPCNIIAVDAALKHLSNKFNVSKEAMKIRLIRENYLIDDSKHPQRINRI